MRTFVLLNHILTEKQETELAKKFGSVQTIMAGNELAAQWSQIKADEKLDDSLLCMIKDWLAAAKEGDLVFVQGEMGHTFWVVDYCLRKNLIPIHAVTVRVEHESREGEAVHRSYIFEHKCFRRYRWSIRTNDI